MPIDVLPSGNPWHQPPGKHSSEYAFISDDAKSTMQGRCAKAMKEAMVSIGDLSSWELEQLQMHCGDENFERMRRYALDADFALLYQGLAAMPAGPQGPSAARMNACRIVEETRQANAGTWQWAGPKLGAPREQIKGDGGTAQMFETQAFIGARNANSSAWSKHRSDVEYENSKEMAKRYEEQARAQRKHTDEEIAAQAQEQAWRWLNQETRVVNETLYSETFTHGVMPPQASARQRPAIESGTSAPEAAAADASRKMPSTGAHRVRREGERTTKTVALQPSQTTYHTATERRHGAQPFAGTGSSARVFHIDRVSINPQGDQITHGHVKERKRLDTKQSVQNKAKQPRLTYSQLDFRQASAAPVSVRQSQWTQSASSAAASNSAAGGQLSPWSTTRMMGALPPPASLPAFAPHPLGGSMPAASRHDDTLRVSRESRDGLMRRLDPVKPTKKRVRPEARPPLFDPSIAKPVQQVISAMRKLLPHSKSSSVSHAGQAHAGRTESRRRLRPVSTAQARVSTAPASHSARLARMLEQLRGNIWDGDVIDLVPQLLLRLPDIWPQHRILLIEDTIAQAHTALVPPGHPNFSDGGEYHGKDLNKLTAEACANAVHVLRMRTATGLPHYEMIRGKERIAVAADGDCFFRAVMASARGRHPSEISGRDIASLRKRLADYLAANAADFVPFLGTGESAAQVQTQAPRPAPGVSAVQGNALAPDIGPFAQSGNNNVNDSDSDNSCDTVIIGSEKVAWDSTRNALRAMAMQSISRLSSVDLAALIDNPCYADPARQGALPKDFETVSNMLAHMCMTRGEEAAPELLAVRNLFIAGTLDHSGNGQGSDLSDDADVWKYKHVFKGWKRIRPGAREACTLFILKYAELNEAIAPTEIKPANGTQKYEQVESYHVDLWNSMTPEMRHTIGGVAPFAELLGLSPYTMRYRLSRSHGIPLAGERAYTGNTASYQLLMKTWTEMSGRERRAIDRLRGFAKLHGVDYQTFRSNLWHFQAEAAERLQARPAPMAQAGSADSTLPEAGLQPKIEALETVENVNLQPYNNACLFLSHPRDPKRSMMPKIITRGKLDPVIYQQVVQWIADEGPRAAARMDALMEVVEAVDEWGERDQSVFAREDIKEGMVIGIYAGKLLRKSDGSYGDECEKHGADAINAYAFDLENKDVILSGYQAGNILSKINSAHPDQSVPQEAQGELRSNNLCAMPVGQHMVCLVTTCKIPKGRELLLDYGKQYKIAKHRPSTVKTEETEAERKVRPAPEREGQYVKGSSRGVRGKANIVPTELPFLGKAPKGSNSSHVLHHPKTGWYALEKKPAASRALPPRYAYLPKIVLDGQQYYFYYAPQAYLPVAPGRISTLWKVQTPNGDDTGHVLRYDAEAARWCHGDLVLRDEEQAPL